MNIPSISVKDLHTHLGFSIPLDYPETSLSKPLTEWKMETDDSPIFRYIYRSFQPKRHLEFGTWEGTGTLYCLEESKATVWTINLPHGETKDDGSWAYPNSSRTTKRRFYYLKKKLHHPYPTDALGNIGTFYLEAGLGERVCQIYCDSREWDISNYPPDFFDTILIDGGHQEDIVTSDTLKALQLVRSGGIIMWHDFCEHPDVLNNFSSPKGVISSIYKNLERLNKEMKDVFWINPSWILLGIKR